MGPDENFPNSSWCFPLNSINSSSCFSKIWSGGEILAWNFLSKWSSKDGCSEVMVSTSFWMCTYENLFNSSWCFPFNSINSSSCFFKLWPDGEILDWDFLWKWSAEDGFSEVIVSTTFWMCSYENIFDISFRHYLRCFRVYSCLLKAYQIFLVTPLVCWLINQSWFCVVCCDMFLPNVEVFLLLVYLFDPIVLGNASVIWLKNQ